MPRKTPISTAQPPPFEDSLEQLKTIVGALESGNLTLSDSLEKYEQGVKHLKGCFAALESAQKKIEMLVRLDDDGKLTTEPFDDSATIRPNRKKGASKRYATGKEAVDSTDQDSSNDELDGDDPLDSSALF